jgi:hypothetical protein
LQCLGAAWFALFTALLYGFCAGYFTAWLKVALAVRDQHSYLSECAHVLGVVQPASTRVSTPASQCASLYCTHRTAASVGWKTPRFAVASAPGYNEQPTLPWQLIAASQ